MTTDLGKGSARTNNAIPRQRGGAHAATKTGRFRRKSAPRFRGAISGPGLRARSPERSPARWVDR